MTLSMFLIKGVIVLGAATLAWLILRRRSAVLRDRIWTMTFAALLLVMLAPLLPSWSVPLPRLEPVPDTANVVASPAPRPGAEQASVTAPRIAARQDSRPVPVSAARSFNRETIVRWATLVWAFGAFVLLARIGLEAASLAAVRRKAGKAPERTQRINERCAARLGLQRTPPVRLSHGVQVPIVFGGWRRSTVLLPRDAGNWSAQRLESVLLHEFAHIRRNDAAITLLSALACALHWMNPLVWWAARRAVTDREEACDMRVLATGTDRFDYVQHLLDTARGIRLQNKASPLCLLTVPRMASASSLYQRVEALLGNGTPVAELGRAKSRATLIVAVAAVIPIACARVADHANEFAGFTSGSATIAQLLDTSLGAERRLHAAWELGEREDDDAVAALLTTLEDEDPALRGMSAWALGEIKEASALPHLIAAIDDEDPKAREMVIRAIGEIEDPRAVEPLIAATRFANEEHRAAAVRALGDLDWSADARAALEEALADSSTVVRKAAVFALAESGYYAGATNALIPLLNDEAANVRALAAESLGVIGSPAAVDALIVASRDNDPEVRAWAVWALDEIDVEGR